jgi:aromatic amino acid transport protein AroP
MTEQKDSLRRGLKNRHIQLIALGGAIGTGLFLGTASTIKMAGPAVILSYAVGGLIAFLIMRQLGEMMAQEPVAGSFSNLAYKYWGDFPGLLSGWNYWILYVLVGMAELTAVGVYVKFWFPGVENWQTIIVFFLLINVINLAAVKVFGEMEFWFASIKVAAIIGMIILGGYVLLTAGPDSHSSVSNLWAHGGFFPEGGYGVFISLAVVMFSFGGLELVGIAAAEADDPQKTIPKAVNQVIYRILIFYVGALVVLLCLYPWNQLGTVAKDAPWAEAMASSPFVQIFSNIGIPAAAHVLNVVILTAALSVYNSGVYCNSRMLYGLALQGNAPRVFDAVNSRGVPVAALGLSSAATLVCVGLNYLMPKDALGLLMALVVGALVINWAMISLTHIKFRRAKERAGELLYFPSLWFPLADYVCLIFMGVILVILCLIGMGTAVALAPIWIGMVAASYWGKKKVQKRNRE